MESVVTGNKQAGRRDKRHNIDTNTQTDRERDKHTEIHNGTDRHQLTLLLPKKITVFGKGLS